MNKNAYKCLIVTEFRDLWKLWPAWQNGASQLLVRHSFIPGSYNLIIIFFFFQAEVCTAYKDSFEIDTSSLSVSNLSLLYKRVDIEVKPPDEVKLTELDRPTAGPNIFVCHFHVQIVVVKINF
jgi:hypothetical protein